MTTRKRQPPADSVAAVIEAYSKGKDIENLRQWRYMGRWSLRTDRSIQHHGALLPNDKPQGIVVIMTMVTYMLRFMAKHAS